MLPLPPITTGFGPRCNLGFRLSVLVAALLAASGGPARAADPLPGPENWTVKFTYEADHSQQAVTQHWTASGSATLNFSADGKAIGSGQLSATQQITAPGATIKTAGSGGFSCGGARHGDYLAFWFERKEIPLSGTMTSPVGTVPIDLSFSTELIGPGPGGPYVIKREPGRKSAVVLVPTPGMTSRADFELQPASAIGKDPEPLPGTFPDQPNLWTLEMNSAGTHATPMGNVQGAMSGRLRFPLPHANGPARGEGDLKVSYTGNMEGRGRIILRGEVKDDYLLFDTRALLTEVTMAGSSAHNGDGQWFWDQLPVKLKLEDEETVTRDVSCSAGGVTYKGQVTWKLTGEKLERWQVLVDGWDTHYVGDQMEACGVRVNWRMDLTITVSVKGESRTFKEGTGGSSLPSIEPHSHPPGMYSVQVVPGIWLSASGKSYPTPYVNLPSYPVAGTVGGKEVSLKLPGDSQEPIYKVDFKGTLASKVAAKHYATGKGSNPQILRKEIKDVGVGVFPFSVRATLQDGWSTSDAPPDALCGMKITVHRLDK